jgi:hypothetical protein
MKKPNAHMTKHHGVNPKAETFKAGGMPKKGKNKTRGTGAATKGTRHSSKMG